MAEKNMNNAIERGRQYFKDEKEIGRVSGEIFREAIDLLATRPNLVKGVPFFRYRIFRFTDASDQPDIDVEIKSGLDLKKAKKVYIRIQGLETLVVQKEGWGDEKVFIARKWSLDSPEVNENDVRGYLNAISQIKTKLNSRQM